ncbi:hypothetical protein ACIF8T_21275 [Streptomyces sp. NPDC085946]|uniref:hypothetical protein n=1 Tax=Streptomyces sp. NPDC085946 TaxID=3365744 RepID=UPI0037CF4F9E
MPIVHSDRISGTIYVIADNAETAGDQAIEYLRDKGDDREHNHYGVFDEREAADKELHNQYNSYDPKRDRVYAFSLDIRIADEK